MNETVMILREGKMGRIITMMKVIIAAIYLFRAPPLSPRGCECSSPLEHARARPPALTQPPFICWPAATARHSSRQLAADAGELLTITPTAPPPASPQVSVPPVKAPPRHPTAVPPPCLFLKTFCLPVSTFLARLHKVSLSPPLRTNTHDKKKKKKRGPIGRVTDATVLQASNQAKAPRTN